MKPTKAELLYNEYLSKLGIYVLLTVNRAILETERGASLAYLRSELLLSQLGSSPALTPQLCYFVVQPQARGRKEMEIRYDKYRDTLGLFWHLDKETEDVTVDNIAKYTIESDLIEKAEDKYPIAVDRERIAFHIDRACTWHRRYGCNEFRRKAALHLTMHGGLIDVLFDRDLEDVIQISSEGLLTLHDFEVPGIRLEEVNQPL